MTYDLPVISRSLTDPLLSLNNNNNMNVNINVSINVLIYVRIFIMVYVINIVVANDCIIIHEYMYVFVANNLFVVIIVIVRIVVRINMIK